MNGDAYSVIRAIRGPITLITLGALFALNNFTQYRFEQTWPVLLIVFGLLSLMKRSAQPPAPAPPPRSYQATGYAQSPYSQPPAGSAPSSTGPSKGGFGTSAPPRAASGPDAGQPASSSAEGGSV
ncbi:MAG TPA: DUF5668 domain-containing protein [Bryobacteraceae bacterium]|nr:DUF5668 domain-containing protein [Bryobacteraceae bacterium]